MLLTSGGVTLLRAVRWCLLYRRLKKRFIVSLKRNAPIASSTTSPTVIRLTPTE